MRVVLPVLYLKESSNYKLGTDQDLEISDYIETHAIFYNIEVVEPLKNRPNRCCVTASGHTFDVNLSMKEVDKKIMHQRRTMYYGGGN
jgi:hypothetical protein